MSKRTNYFTIEAKHQHRRQKEAAEELASHMDKEIDLLIGTEKEVEIIGFSHSVTFDAQTERYGGTGIVIYSREV